jgi:hypothetical protein
MFMIVAPAKLACRATILGVKSSKTEGNSSRNDHVPANVHFVELFSVRLMTDYTSGTNDSKLSREIKVPSNVVCDGALRGLVTKLQAPLWLSLPSQLSTQGCLILTQLGKCRMTVRLERATLNTTYGGTAYRKGRISGESHARTRFETVHAALRRRRDTPATANNSSTPADGSGTATPALLPLPAVCPKWVRHT